MLKNCGAKFVIAGHSERRHIYNEDNKLISKKNYEKLLNRFNIKKGDYFYIDAGTIHAICKDTVLLEVQQSSDITFRIYDYDRLDFENKLRPLHIEEALACINVPNDKVKNKHNNKYFDYEIINVKNKMNFLADNHGDYLVVLEGSGVINQYNCKPGDFIMISSETKYCLSGNFKIQRTRF